MNEMRVCLLSRKIIASPGGGYERYSLDVYNGLKERAISIELLSQNSSIPPFRSPISPLFYDVMAVPSGVLLRKVKRKEGVNVYHATIPTQGLYFPMIPWRNTVVTFHDMIGIANIKDILTGARFLDKIWNIYSRVATILALKYAGRIIAISEQAKEEVMSLVNVPSEKIVVIPHSVGEHFHPLDGCRSKVPTIGYLGNLILRKGIDFLLRAFHILKQTSVGFDCRLKICGGGLEEGNLINLASRLGLTDVDFTGLIPEDKIVDIYNSFALFVYPSSYEGFGFPILEAQKCGVPVLIRRDSRIPNEVTRFAIECTSEQDMADKMCNLLTNQELYREISEKGMNYAKQFTLQRFTEKTLGVYESVCR